MSNANPSRLGQVNAAGDPLAIFLKVFAGQVLAAFDRNTAFKQRHLVRTISNGKSAQFPVTGLATSRYHTPGAEILGQAIRHGERVISVEDLLISDVFIANIDELMNHYDVQSIYSNELGQAMAKMYDQNVSRAGINAARGTAAVTGLPGGANIENASFATDGTALWNGIFSAATTMDVNDVPQNDRYAFVRPVQYALLVRSEKPINRDLGNEGNGSLASGQIYRINDVEIVKTNNLVSSDDRAATDQPSSRQNDYSVTQGLVTHKNAMGTVQLQDLTMETDYQVNRQGTLMVAKQLVGHDKLRPEAAVELRSGTPAS